jgi:ribonucleoside-triphosphate reductase
LSTENSYLPTLYQQQIHKTKYARWDENLGRREDWPETVSRYVTYIKEHCEERGTPLDDATWTRIEKAILKQDVLPSMRALMTAGPAAKRDEVAIYNCSYLEVNRIESFDEAMYILMCGVGVGFSVEQQYVEKLPVVSQTFVPGDIIVVEDSKIGWATAVRTAVTSLYNGRIPKVDISLVRPAGAILKTFGGRASGPQPLVDLMDHLIETFQNAAGRKLTSLEAHGIMCKIGDVVVVGGVRRSALISLSDPTDDTMRDAKSGQWWEENPHFALANNTAVWTGRPDRETFDAEWKALRESGSGERGFFNRTAAQNKVEAEGNRESEYPFGLNPCGEIFLRDRQFCNLSQITARADDTYETLKEKVEIATIIGTIQSTLTNFRYLSDEWKVNCDNERLLGVGFTGVMDSPLMNGTVEGLDSLLDSLKLVARGVNAEVAGALGINVSAAITCMKPAGNSTELVGSKGNGLHSAHAKYYIRTNRGNKTDPVAQFLYYQGVPAEDEKFHADTTYVFSYPMKAPEGGVVKEDRTAIEQLEAWLVYAEHWCEHNPSVTVNIKEDEWEPVADWLYEHFDRVPAVSFLPHSEHTYEQAPYQEITKEQYEELLAEMPKEVDWDMLQEYETNDMTEGSQELSCVGGACLV